MAQTLRVGLIGLGYIGRIHALAYQNIGYCFGEPPVRASLVAALRSRLDTAAEAVQTAGFELVTTDPDAFFAHGLDVVDICCPNDLHRGFSERALRAGIPVYCEKPLAHTLADARAMAALADESGVYTQVAYTNRYGPAIRQMKALINAGEIGEVYHFNARIFHSSYLDVNRPMTWRLRREDSGGGAFMDLGAHLVDLTRYLLGDAEAVRAWMRTLIPQRCVTRGSAERACVDVDDWALTTLELKSGAVGAIEASRMAAGVPDPTTFAVFGSKGSLLYRSAEPDAVQFNSLQRKQTISGKVDAPPIAGERPIQALWPEGKYSLGGFVNRHMAAQYDLLLNLAQGGRSSIDFGAAAAAQEVIAAAYLSAARDGERVALPLG